MIVKHQAEDGQYYYTVNSSNGKVLATSELYPTRDHLNRGVDAMQRADLLLIASRISNKKPKEQPIPAPVVAAFDPAQPFAVSEGDEVPDMAPEADVYSFSKGMGVNVIDTDKHKLDGHIELATIPDEVKSFQMQEGGEITGYKSNGIS